MGLSYFDDCKAKNLHGNNRDHDPDSPARDESRHHEHRNIDRSGTDTSANDQYHCSDLDGVLPRETVGGPGVEEGPECGTGRIEACGK